MVFYKLLPVAFILVAALRLPGTRAWGPEESIYSDWADVKHTLVSNDRDMYWHVAGHTYLFKGLYNPLAELGQITGWLGSAVLQHSLSLILHMLFHEKGRLLFPVFPNLLGWRKLEETIYTTVPVYGLPPVISRRLLIQYDHLQPGWVIYPVPVNALNNQHRQQLPTDLQAFYSLWQTLMALNVTELRLRPAAHPELPGWYLESGVFPRLRFNPVCPRGERLEKALHTPLPSYAFIATYGLWRSWLFSREQTSNRISCSLFTEDNLQIINSALQRIASDESETNEPGSYSQNSQNSQNCGYPAGHKEHADSEQMEFFTGAYSAGHRLGRESGWLVWLKDSDGWLEPGHEGLLYQPGWKTSREILLEQDGYGYAWNLRQAPEFTIIPFEITQRILFTLMGLYSWWQALKAGLADSQIVEEDLSRALVPLDIDSRGDWETKSGLARFWKPGIYGETTGYSGLNPEGTGLIHASTALIKTASIKKRMEGFPLVAVVQAGVSAGRFYQPLSNAGQWLNQGTGYARGSGSGSGRSPSSSPSSPSGSGSESSVSGESSRSPDDTRPARDNPENRSGDNSGGNGDDDPSHARSVTPEPRPKPSGDRKRASEESYPDSVKVRRLVSAADTTVTSDDPGSGVVIPQPDLQIGSFASIYEQDRSSDSSAGETAPDISMDQEMRNRGFVRVSIPEDTDGDSYFTAIATGLNAYGACTVSAQVDLWTADKIQQELYRFLGAISIQEQGAACSESAGTYVTSTSTPPQGILDALLSKRPHSFRDPNDLILLLRNTETCEQPSISEALTKNRAYFHYSVQTRFGLNIVVHSRQNGHKSTSHRNDVFEGILGRIRNIFIRVYDGSPRDIHLSVKRGGHYSLWLSSTLMRQLWAYANGNDPARQFLLKHKLEPTETAIPAPPSGELTWTSRAELIAQVTEKSQELSTLQDELQQACQARDSIAQQFAQAQSALADASAAREQIQTEHAELTQKLDLYTASFADLQRESVHSKDLLNTQLQYQQQRVQGTEHRLQQVLVELMDKENQLSQLMAEQQQRLNEMKHQITAVQSSKEQVEEELIRKETELKKMRKNEEITTHYHQQELTELEEKMNELRLSLEAKRQEMTKLQGINEQVNDELHQLKQETEQQSEVITQVTQRLQDRQAEVDQLSSSGKKSREEFEKALAQKEKQVSQLMAEQQQRINEMKTQITAVQSSKEQAEVELTRKETEIETMRKNEEITTRHHQQELTELEDKMNELRLLLETKRQEMTKLQGINEQVNDELHQLKQETEQQSEVIIQVTQRLQDRQAEVDQLSSSGKESREEFEKALAQKEKQVSQLMAEQQQRLNEMKHQITAVQSSKEITEEELTRKATELETMRKNEEITTRHHQQELTELEEKMNELRLSLEAKRQEMTKLQGINEQVNDELHQLKQETEQQSEVITQVTQRLQDTQAEVDQLSSSGKKSREEFEKALAQKEKQVSQLMAEQQQRINEMKTQITAVQSSKEQVEEELIRKETELNKMRKNEEITTRYHQQELTELEDKMNKLRLSLETKQQEMTKLQEIIEQVSNELRQVKQQTVQQTDTVHTLESKLSASDSLVSSQQDKITQLEQQLAFNRGRLIEYSTAFSVKMCEITQSLVEIGQLRADLEKVTTDRDQSNEKIRELQEKIDQESARADQLTTGLEEKTTEITALETKLSQARQEKESTSAKLSELHSAHSRKLTEQAERFAAEKKIMQHGHKLLLVNITARLKQSQAAARAEWHSETERLQQQISQLEAGSAHHQSQAKLLTEQRDKLAALLKELYQQYERLQAETKEREADINQLRADLNDATADRDQSNAKLPKLQETIDQERSRAVRLTTDLDEKNIEIATLKTELSQLEANSAHHQSQAGLLTGQRDQLVALLKALYQQYQTLEADRDREQVQHIQVIQSLKKRLEESQQELTSERIFRQQLSAKVVNLRHSLDYADKYVFESETQSAQSELLQLRIKQLEAERSTLIRRLEDRAELGGLSFFAEENRSHGTTPEPDRSPSYAASAQELAVISSPSPELVPESPADSSPFEDSISIDEEAEPVHPTRALRKRPAKALTAPVRKSPRLATHAQSVPEVAVQDKPATQPTVVTKRPRVVTLSRRSPELQKLVALGQQGAGTQAYLKALALYVMTHPTRNCLVTTFKALQLPSPTHRDSAIAASNNWAAGHMNYLEWKYQHLASGIKDKKPFIPGLPDGKHMLKLLNPGHPDYEILFKFLLRKQLKIEEGSPVLWDAKESLNYKHVASHLQTYSIPMIPRLKRRPPGFTHWSSQALRWLFKMDGVQFIQQGRTKISMGDVERIASMNPGSEEYNQAFYIMLREWGFDIELLSWTRNMAAVRKTDPGIKLPVVSGLNLPRARLEKAAVMLWLVRYRNSFKDLKHTSVKPRTVWQALKMIKNPESHQLVFEQLLSLLHHYITNNRRLRMYLSNHHIQAPPWISQFSEKKIVELRRTLPEVEFKSRTLKPDGTFTEKAQ